ncbi:MAG: hypothetical protein ACLP5H_18365 [Desulfomonilaceae bacterium]
MDDKKKKNEESVSRRSFLTSLGKWSSIVVATAVLGISEASGSDEPPKEAGAAREGIPGQDVAQDESVESQWWRWRRGLGCRVWGNSGCRVWGNRGCRVWGNR